MDALGLTPYFERLARWLNRRLGGTDDDGTTVHRLRETDDEREPLP